MFSVYFLETLTSVDYFPPFGEKAGVRGMPFSHSTGVGAGKALFPGEQTFVTEKALDVFHNDYSPTPPARATRGSSP